MVTARAMEDKRPVYEIPVQYGKERAQEKDTAELRSTQGDIIEEVQMSPMALQRKRLAVPIQVKVLLTLEEAAEYTGLGMQKLRNISNSESCGFVLWNGTKRMFKRAKLQAYLENAYSI